MLNTRARAALVGAAVFVAAMLGGAESARAAIYRGNWDPAYGAPFTDLGWKGTATFFIPDACLSGTALVANSAACSSNGMKMLGANVSFYNATLDPLGLNILETLTYSPPAPYVYSMQVTNSVLTGINTGFSDPAIASSSIAGSGFYSFDLKFYVTRTGTGSVQLFHSPIGMDPTCAYDYPGSLNYDPRCGFNDPGNAPTLTLTLVPEPATVALVLAGLVAIGLTVRRRRG